MKKNIRKFCVFIALFVLSNITYCGEIIDQKSLIEIIKSASGRASIGYNGSPISGNNIILYVNDKEVMDYNKFPDLFKLMKLNLNQKEIDLIHIFIGYVSENAGKYKNMKFDLFEVYNNISYFDFYKNEIVINNFVIDKIIDENPDLNSFGGYNGEPISKNKITFYVRGSQIFYYNEFGTQFLEYGIDLKWSEIMSIHKFIGFISKNALRYKNLKLDLYHVYEIQQNIKKKLSDNYWENFRRWESYETGNNDSGLSVSEADEFLDQLTIGVSVVYFKPKNRFDPQNPSEYLKNFWEISSLRSTEKTIGGASFFRTKNENGEYIASFLTMVPDKLKADIDKSDCFIWISSDKINKYEFVQYVKTRQEDKENNISIQSTKFKKPDFINDNDYKLQITSENNENKIYNLFTSKLKSQDAISTTENKILLELDVMKCNKTSQSDIISKYGYPDKVLIVEENNQIFLTYFYGELLLYFGTSWDILIEKRFLNAFGIKDAKYSYQGKIRLGTTLNEVINFLGNPKMTIDGKANTWQDEVLYKNIGGKKGFHYISYKSKGIRIFFADDKIHEFMLTE